jgi:flavin-dependent thymidylate synthase
MINDKNDNKVQLIGYYGSDQVHACSAWTSTSRDLSDEKINRIPKLLKMLADAGHHTPFEKSALHFLIDTDIASHVHLIKHRVGTSVNGESARYKEIKEDKYLIPDDWEGIKCSQKSNLSTGIGGLYNNNYEGIDWSIILNEYTKLGNLLYHASLKDLEPVLGRKRAKESARYFKTYGSQIQADVMFNWRSFYHFLNLRNKEDAQKEIREIAAHMLHLVKNIEGNPFQHTIAAFDL